MQIDEDELARVLCEVQCGYACQTPDCLKSGCAVYGDAARAVIAYIVPKVREDERARIKSWLRNGGCKHYERRYLKLLYRHECGLADAIERGEHMKDTQP